MKWIEKKNKKMSASRVYDEFDPMFTRLPTTNQVLLEEEKTLYFLNDVDMKDKQELGTLLKDDTQSPRREENMVYFEKAILVEFAIEDLSRMTRHVLMKWIEKKNKNMSASRVYDEMFSRFPATDQALLEEDKTLYFLKVVDVNDR